MSLFQRAGKLTQPAHECGGVRSIASVPGVVAGVALILWSFVAAGTAQGPPAGSTLPFTCEEMEGFLKTAKIEKRRDLSVGVTVPSRATLNNGKVQHDASIQVTDISQTTYRTPRGTELNFRDSWKFNVAGYELAKILHLNMVPPYVERSVAGVSASVSWWVNDAMMERDRYRKKIEPPDVDTWNKEMYAVRVFHQLIYDTDPNLTNLLITKDWRIWMIDFSRAFRVMKNLQNPEDLTYCDRRLLASLRELTEERLQQKLGRWLTKSEIQSLVARRDQIVTLFDNAVTSNGESKVLYDLPRMIEPCGTGLQ